MKKLLLSLIVAFVAVFALVGCGSKTTANVQTTKGGNNQTTNGGQTTKSNATEYDVTIWVSEVKGVKELTQQQVDAFNKANPDIKINATIEGVGEGDAATQMITSVETGADIFCFAQDQLARLVDAGALTKLGVKTGEKVTAENTAGSVYASKYGDDLYCFPLTDDNGYFMYYDKSVISDEIVGSLEDIITACENAGKYFSFELENGWYVVSFFFGAGCKSSWTQTLDPETEEMVWEITDDFNSEKGLIALEGMQKLVKSSCYNNSSKAASFSDATPSAVVVSGTWDYTVAKAALGENFGVAELPSFTVDGKTYHLGSFNGCKLLGMKPQKDAYRAAAIQRLALYLTGEECQVQRFEQFGWGPSSKAALATDKVKEDETLKALNAQNAYAYPQGQIHGSWWDIAKVIATEAIDAEATAEARQGILNNYTASIKKLFNMSVDEKNAFTLIGAIGGTNWDADLEMAAEEGEDGKQIWVTKEPYLMAEGVEFKIRQGKSWENALGSRGVDGNEPLFNADANYVPAEETYGKYLFIQMTYDPETNCGKIELLPYVGKYSFSVIGAFGDNNWNKDFEMHYLGEGVWESEAIEFTAEKEDNGVQSYGFLKVRFGLGWDQAYPAANLAVETAGTYVVRLTLADGQGSVELVPAE